MNSPKFLSHSLKKKTSSPECARKYKKRASLSSRGSVPTKKRETPSTQSCRVTPPLSLATPPHNDLLQSHSEPRFSDHVDQKRTPPLLSPMRKDSLSKALVTPLPPAAFLQLGENPPSPFEATHSPQDLHSLPFETKEGSPIEMSGFSLPVSPGNLSLRDIQPIPPSSPILPRPGFDLRRPTQPLMPPASPTLTQPFFDQRRPTQPIMPPAPISPPLSQPSFDQRRPTQPLMPPASPTLTQPSFDQRRPTQPIMPPASPTLTQPSFDQRRPTQPIMPPTSPTLTQPFFDQRRPTQPIMPPTFSSPTFSTAYSSFDRKSPSSLGSRPTRNHSASAVSEQRRVQTCLSPPTGKSSFNESFVPASIVSSKLFYLDFEITGCEAGPAKEFYFILSQVSSPLFLFFFSLFLFSFFPSLFLSLSLSSTFFLEGLIHGT